MLKNKKDLQRAVTYTHMCVYIFRDESATEQTGSASYQGEYEPDIHFPTTEATAISKPPPKANHENISSMIKDIINIPTNYMKKSSNRENTCSTI